MEQNTHNISKELLKDVLKNPDILWEGWKSGRKNSKILHYSTGYTSYHQHTISLWELFHRCKKWAFENGFSIESSSGDGEGTAKILDKEKRTVKTFAGADEIDAVMKSCDHIKSLLA